MLFEQSAEIIGVVISDGIGDLDNIVTGVLKEVKCIGHSKLNDILHWSDLGNVLKGSVEPAFAHVTLIGVVLDANIQVIVFIEIVSCTLYLVKSIRVKLGSFL